MDDKWKSVATVIGLMVALFGLLEIFLPASLIQPVGALVIGLALTAYLVSINKWTWGTAFPTWLTVSIALIVVYLIVSRPATVVGSVIESNGVPVAGLTLVLTDSSGVEHKAIADENGTFEIKNIPEGRFTISADGELLISGRIPSGWARIFLAAPVEIGSVVYKPSPIATVPDTPTPADTPAPTLTPPATTTSLQTETPTPAPTPVPLECRHPELTAYVFPQLKDVPGQRAFYGPLEESKEVFLCEGVRDIVYSDPVAVRIEYHTVHGTGKFGFFGIGTLGGYDATPFNRICLWAYATQPGQAFRLKVRDTYGRERGVNVTVKDINKWSQICVDLDNFSNQGVDLTRLDNINLGFEEANGSATVWVDDFELVK